MPWSPELDKKLVDLIKPHEYIWNTKHKYHKKHSYKKKETYEEIARALGPDITANSVKARWKNVRGTYSHYLLRVERSKHPWKPSEVHKPTWHLWQSLQFLPHNPQKNISRPNVVRVKIKNEPPNAIADQLPQNASDALGESSYEVLLEGTHNHSESNVDEASDIKTYSEKSQCEKVLEEAKMILKLLESDPRLDLKINYEYAILGKQVASSLSSMCVDDASEASKKIIDILLSYPQTNKEIANGL